MQEVKDALEIGIPERIMEVRESILIHLDQLLAEDFSIRSLIIMAPAKIIQTFRFLPYELN